MLSTRKNPRQPTSIEQQHDVFTWSARRADHFLNTLDRKVHVLDGYGNLITVARTSLQDSKVKRNPGLSITTSFVHDKRSRTEQVEDHDFMSPSKELAELYDVTGNAGVVLSQTVDFSLEELRANEIIRDINSNYCISLDRECLLQYAERRGTRDEDKTPITNVNKSSLALNLTIIDNRAVAPESYFVNIAGRIFCVPVMSSPDVEDGVWIDSNLKQQGIAMLEFQSLDDSVYREDREVIPPVTLFATALEAKRFGDAEAVLKEQARKQELELINLKHDLELTKAESAKAKAELEDKSNVRKDVYEERSAKRKDDSDKVGIVAKTIAAVVAVAASIVGFIRWLG